MESEQKTSLKSVTSRIDIEDYAKLIEAMGRWSTKDMSSLIRKIIHDHVKDFQLDQGMLAWVEEQRTKDAERRAKNSTKKMKRPSLLAKLFGFAK